MSRRLKTILLGLALFLAVIGGVYVVYTVQQPSAPSPTPTPRVVASPSPSPTAVEVFVVNPNDACALSFSVSAELTPGLNCVSKVLYVDDPANTSGVYTLIGNKLTSNFELVPGEQYVYGISYQNTGTGIADGIIEDELPAGLTYVDSSDECTYAEATRLITCDIASVSPNGSGFVAIRFSVDEAIDLESVTNVATVTPTSGEESVCQLSNPIQGTEVSPSPSASLNAELTCLTKRAFEDNASNGPGSYYLNTEITNTNTLTDGQTVVFNVAIKNIGDAAAPSVEIVDVLSSNLTYVDGESGCTYAAETRTVTCAVGSLSANTETSRSFRARITTATTTAIANTADVTSSNGQSDSCSLTVNAQGQVVEQPSPIPSELPAAGVFEVTVGTLGLGILLLIVGAIGLLLI